MKKFLLAILVACTFVISNNSLQAQQTSVMTNRPLIWGSSPFQDSLWSIDTTTWQVVNRIAPSLPGFTITGCTGLAQDPTTGICYVIMKVSAVSGRVLGTIDLSTGVCTQVGNLGDNFATINFREDGQLFGVTGNGATVPETMYLIDKTNATKTVAAALGAGADGEIICFNRVDNFFYHWSGNGTIVYEKVMSVAPYTATNIPISGTTSGETFGAMYVSPNNFLISNISSSFNHCTPGGNWTAAMGSNPDDLRGLIMMPYWQISNATVCQGTAQTVTVGGHQLYDTLFYHWGDGSIDTMMVTNGVLNNATHTYASAGSYTANVSTGNGFGGDTVITIAITVNPSPTVALGGLAAICSGDSTQLFANAPAGTYQWYMNGSPVAGGTNSSLMVGSAGIYNMLCTNTFGCADSSASSITVVTSTYPVVSLGNDTSGCSWYVIDAGNAGSTFLWSDSTTTQMDTAMTSGGYGVWVTNTDGCASFDSINITINTPPTVNIGPDTTACGSYMVDAGNPGSTYLWCDGSTTQTTNLTTSGSCAVTVTDANGCSAMDTINVTINPNPVVVLGPDVSACTMVVITADSSLIGGTFLWCTGGTGLNEVITNSTTCDLQYTDVNGCTGSDTINVTIYGNPTVTASSAPTSLCADDADAVLTGSPAGGSFTGTSVTGNNFDPSIGAGNYSIIYNFTDVNGCSGADTISIQVNACVGIAENNAAGFSMYPNPTSGMLNFNLTETSAVEVIDVLGNVVASKQFNSGAAQIDLSSQPNGVYFVRVNGANTQRVVLQK